MSTTEACASDWPPGRVGTWRLWMGGDDWSWVNRPAVDWEDAHAQLVLELQIFRTKPCPDCRALGRGALPDALAARAGEPFMAQVNDHVCRVFEEGASPTVTSEDHSYLPSPAGHERKIRDGEIPGQSGATDGEDVP